MIRQQATSFVGSLLMLKRTRARVAAKYLAALMLVCASASATIDNPLPADFGSDTGASYFLPGNAMFAVKLYDPLAAFGYVTGFGFYRAGTPPLDPANSGLVFDATDAVGDVTAVDFVNGAIFDIDAGVFEGLFTPGIQPIGFFFLFAPPGGPTITLFSDPALNGGLDLFASFPSLTTPDNFLFGFEIPIPGAGPVTATLELVGPLAAAPEPGSLALIAAGLLPACFALRRRRSI